MHVQDAEIEEVLQLLGQQAGLNILASKDVGGRVSAVLYNVDAETALLAILRSQGYVWRREENFLYVYTPDEYQSLSQLEQKLATRVYRPHYVKASELQSLIVPILTDNVGRSALTSPSEIGIAPGSEQVGGNSFAQGDVLLVQDYESVLEQVDEIVAQVDVVPMQVLIEAMILSVELNDNTNLGVNFALLNGSQDALTLFGDGSVLADSSGFPSPANIGSVNPVTGAFVPNAEFRATGRAGLKFGVVEEDVSAFIEALESVGKTDVIASPHVLALNKQRAEIIIGRRSGFRTTTVTETAAVESVEFLETGTQLRIRPFISPDGIIRMEVHPERSDGFVNPETGLPEEETTEVTSNVLVRDNTTLVIGGLIEEETETSYSQVPLLGSIPVAGRIFQQQTERQIKKELIVLITPRIVREPIAGAQAAARRDAFLHQNQVLLDRQSWFRRDQLAQREYEKALEAWNRGDVKSAERHVDLALHFHVGHADALRLREQMDLVTGTHPLHQPPIGEPGHHWITEPSSSGAAAHQIGVGQEASAAGHEGSTDVQRTGGTRTSMPSGSAQDAADGAKQTSAGWLRRWANAAGNRRKSGPEAGGGTRRFIAAPERKILR